MKQNTKRVGSIAQFCGLAGLVLLLFGALTAFLLYGEFDRLKFIPLHFGLGLLLLAVFFFKGGHAVVRESSGLKRRLGWGVGLTLYSVLFLGVLIVLNAVLERTTTLRYDSTEGQVFTLAPQTTKIVESLASPVVIRGFYVGGQVEKPVQELLDRLTRQFPSKLSFRVVDPEKNPALAERLGISQTGTLHLSFTENASPNTEKAKAREVKLTSKISEQEIANALLKLSRSGEKRLCYLEGHGEADLTSNLEDGFVFVAEAIQGENLVLQPLKLAESDNRVPESCGAVLVAGPKRALLAAELSALEKFAAGGGGLMLMHEPNGSPDVANFAAKLGITVGQDVVVQDVGTLLGSRLVAFELTVSAYGEHEITKEFKEYTAFSLASSVRAIGTKPAAAKLTELAFSSSKTWAETDLASALAETPTASPDEAEKKGPLAVAVAFEGRVPLADVESKPSRILVFGDANFISNANLRQVYNRDFFLNSLNWVVGEAEGVSIRSGTMRLATRPIAPEQFSLMFLVTTILVPELILLAGLAIWWARRS